MKEVTDQLTNYDVLEALHAEHNEFPQLYDYSIVGLEMSWRCYGGIGNITTETLSFRFPEPYAPQAPTADPTQEYLATVRTVSSVASVPNVGTLLKLSPLISLIDDFSYFVYHGPVYHSGFTLFAEQCWKVTHSKWDLPALLTEALRLNLSSTAPPEDRWPADTLGATPARLRYRT